MLDETVVNVVVVAAATAAVFLLLFGLLVWSSPLSFPSPQRQAVQTPSFFPTGLSALSPATDALTVLPYFFRVLWHSYFGERVGCGDG